MNKEKSFFFITKFHGFSLEIRRRRQKLGGIKFT